MSTITKLVAPLVLGTAIAFGGTTRAADAEKNKAEEPIPVEVKKEEAPPAEQQPKPDNPNSCFGRVLFGYIAGRLAGYFIDTKRYKAKNKILLEDNDLLRKQLEEKSQSQPKPSSNPATEDKA